MQRVLLLLLLSCDLLSVHLRTCHIIDGRQIVTSLMQMTIETPILIDDEKSGMEI